MTHTIEQIDIHLIDTHLIDIHLTDIHQTGIRLTDTHPTDINTKAEVDPMTDTTIGTTEKGTLTETDTRGIRRDLGIPRKTDTRKETDTVRTPTDLEIDMVLIGTPPMKTVIDMTGMRDIHREVVGMITEVTIEKGTDRGTRPTEALQDLTVLDGATILLRVDLSMEPLVAMEVMEEGVMLVDTIMEAVEVERTITIEIGEGKLYIYLLVEIIIIYVPSQ